MHDQESLKMFAYLGLAFLVSLYSATMFWYGFLAGRPTRFEREVLVQVLMEAQPARDEIIAKKRAKLLKFLKPKDWD